MNYSLFFFLPFIVIEAVLKLLFIQETPYWLMMYLLLCSLRSLFRAQLQVAL